MNDLGEKMKTSTKNVNMIEVDAAFESESSSRFFFVKIAHLNGKTLLFFQRVDFGRRNRS